MAFGFGKQTEEREMVSLGHPTEAKLLHKGSRTIPSGRDRDLLRRQQVFLAKLLQWKDLGDDRGFVRMVLRRVTTGTYQRSSDARLKDIADRAGFSMEGL
jgi:hypothetical protein